MQQRLWIWMPAVVAAACSAPVEPAARRAAPAHAVRPASPPIGREVVFTGMCDASGAVPVSSRLFVVADDEDNVLRVYDAELGGAPLSAVDVSAQLGLSLKGKKHPKAPETDLEAATRIDDRAYWLTSHGRNKKGRLETERLFFFATTVPTADAAVALVGRPYGRLLEDLVAAPQLALFGLAAAAQRAPRAPGGLNIEGLTATPDGTLLVGFRNPVPDGQALAIVIENPREIVDAGAPARFGPPIRLALDGRGVRSLSWWRGDYLVAAGNAGDGGESRLYTWDGAGAPVHVALDLRRYNPEGFFTPEDRDEILLLSDDGTVLVDGRPCKRLRDHARRSFRGVWVRLPGSANPGARVSDTVPPVPVE
jgi:hypothetical protein